MALTITLSIWEPNPVDLINGVQTPYVIIKLATQTTLCCMINFDRCVDWQFLFFNQPIAKLLVSLKLEHGVKIT